MDNTFGLVIVVVGMGIGYGIYFYRRAQVKKAGGIDAHSRARLGELFELPADEQVTAAWSGVTVPKLSAAEQAAEVVGAAAAVVVGVGVKIVGRDVALAFTSKNRLLLLDKKDERIDAFGPAQRPRISDTGKKGTKVTSQTQWGWFDGAIVSLEVFGVEPLEIDVAASAVPLLVGWSRGEDVSGLTGPYPMQGTI